MLKIFYKIIFLKLMRWSIDGDKPIPKKYVLIVAPHTSNMDFLIGIFTRKIVGIKSKFLAKKELFVWPLGYFFKFLGGFPVDRSKNKNFVQSLTEDYNKKESFIVTFTPEGTRKFNDKWKSGFYHLAKAAKVPIVRIAFDYKNKKVFIDRLFTPPDNVDECIKQCKKYFSQFLGKNPKNGVIYAE